MKCQNCGENSLSLADVLTCSNGDPVQCGVCKKKFWVHRVLSKIILFSYWYSSIGFMVIIFSFFESIWLGVLSILIPPTIQLLVSYFEVWLLGLREHVGKSKT